MAGVRRGQRPSRAEPCHRLDVRRPMGCAFARSGAGAASLNPDRGRAHHVGRAFGRHRGTRAVCGSRCAATPGGWTARRRRDGSPVEPRSQAGAGASRTCRRALVLRRVHHARRRIDAGADADPALCVGDAPAREITAPARSPWACRGVDTGASLLRSLARKPSRAPRLQSGGP